MRVATLVRAYLPVPRPVDIVYAPLDLALSICEGLLKRDHDVDLFAPDDGASPVRIRRTHIRPLVRTQKEWVAFLNNIDEHMHYVPALWDLYVARQMFEDARKGKYDLLHFHHPEIAMPLASLYPDVPVVSTLHDPLHPWYSELFTMYRAKNHHFISISNSQRKPRKDLRYAATVYNGVDTNLFVPNGKKDDYLLFVGRLVPEKGVKEALEIAKRSRHKLLIAGPIFPDGRRYFNEHIKPLLNTRRRYIGYIKREELLPYYQKAKALLMPIQWEEPFGMNMIEAMACGTPVIALKRGAAKEVVAHKRTGFVCKTVDEMVESIQHVSEIDPLECRRRVIQKFSIEKMVDGYEKVFQEVVRKNRRRLRRRQNLSQ